MARQPERAAQKVEPPEERALSCALVAACVKHEVMNLVRLAPAILLGTPVTIFGEDVISDQVLKTWEDKMGAHILWAATVAILVVLVLYMDVFLTEEYTVKRRELMVLCARLCFVSLASKAVVALLLYKDMVAPGYGVMGLWGLDNVMLIIVFRRKLLGTVWMSRLEFCRSAIYVAVLVATPSIALLYEGLSQAIHGQQQLELAVFGFGHPLVAGVVGRLVAPIVLEYGADLHGFKGTAKEIFVSSWIGVLKTTLTLLGFVALNRLESDRAFLLAGLSNFVTEFIPWIFTLYRVNRPPLIPEIIKRSSAVVAPSSPVGRLVKTLSEAQVRTDPMAIIQANRARLARDLVAEELGETYALMISFPTAYVLDDMAPAILARRFAILVFLEVLCNVLKLVVSMLFGVNALQVKHRNKIFGLVGYTLLCQASLYAGMAGRWLF